MDLTGMIRIGIWGVIEGLDGPGLAGEAADHNCVRSYHVNKKVADHVHPH